MKATASGKVTGGGRQLLLGLIFGAIFGFLLQKGGVGKYHILIGQLLLRDFTVAKVMGTAIVVGMLGVFAMHWMGLVKLHVKATRIGANVIGGLIFGAGFALSAYCPGTNMTALGQGNLDALFVVAGMIVGSYLFAEASGLTKGTIVTWGDRGEPRPIPYPTQSVRCRLRRRDRRRISGAGEAHDSLGQITRSFHLNQAKHMNNLIKTVLLAALTTLPLTAMNAQTEKPSADKTHRIVFEVTMEGPEQWTAVLNNVENLRTALGAATEIEVVAHSKGLGMLVAKDNALTDRMKKLADAGVVFAACENTMKKKNVTKEQLLPFATTTDSGIAEVIRKQEAGWSYIKSGI